MLDLRVAFNESSACSDKLKVVSAKVHGLRHNLELLLLQDFHVMVIQEADVDARDVPMLKAIATQAKCFLEFGELVCCGDHGPTR